MRYVRDFLHSNQERFGLRQYGLTDQLTCMLVTPRFRASSHVLFMVLRRGNPDPVVIAKVPRIPEAAACLRREAERLRFAQTLRAEGLDSIPRVIACESFRGRLILLETALVGAPLDPPHVRRHHRSCCQAATDWLANLAVPHDAGADPAAWFDRQVQQPLDFLREVVPWTAEERLQLQRTGALIEPLRNTTLPPVLEHGDFSHPNVMRLRNGQLGVVDWETADPYGTPTHDLFFFLSYAAFAKARARENGRHLPAIESAFFGSSAWAPAFVRGYAEQLELPEATLSPLFLLCWVRYLAGLLARLTEPSEMVSVETANWLRQNRYFAIWRHTVDNFDRLEWSGGAK